MLDLSHIPNSQQDIQIFNANGSAWQTWRKPKKCNYIYIMCIGGAGGGGAGFPSGDIVYSTAGGSGGISRALYNAQQLSDTLFVQVGLGGIGGTSGSNGFPGTRSFVTLQPSTVVQNILIVSGAAVAAGGRTNSGTNVAGENVVTQATATFLTLSNFVGTAGVTAIGSVTFEPPNVTPLTSSLVTCGAGGGGSITSSSIAYNGGSILSSSISPTILGGQSTLSGAGGRGANGITSFKPFYSLGGAGGGASLSGVGGNGGDGGIGSGGGGGGNGTTIGGTGGKGGDGIVIIISF